MKKLKLEELGRLSVEDYKASQKKDVVLVVDNLRSGLNVGSLFRSADAFGILNLHLCGITPIPPHKEIFKTAIGAEHSVEWTYHEKVEQSIRDLKSAGYSIVGIEQTSMSVPLSNFEHSSIEKLAIVVGNEVEGLSEESLPLLDHAVEIRQFGTKHSLNVAVCTGICLFEFCKNR